MKHFYKVWFVRRDWRGEEIFVEYGSTSTYKGAQTLIEYFCKKFYRPADFRIEKIEGKSHDEYLAEVEVSNDFRYYGCIL